MKAIAAVLLAFTPWAMGAANSCKGDCVKTVTGTQDINIPIVTRKADCSSYMTVTVYATP